MSCEQIDLLSLNVLFPQCTSRDNTPFPHSCKQRHQLDCLGGQNKVIYKKLSTEAWASFHCVCSLVLNALLLRRQKSDKTRTIIAKSYLPSSARCKSQSWNTPPWTSGVLLYLVAQRNKSRRVIKPCLPANTLVLLRRACKV